MSEPQAPDATPEDVVRHPDVAKAFAEHGPLRHLRADERLEIVEFEPLAERRRLPGPGLPEALAWSGGVFAAHLGAGIALTLLVLVMLVATGTPLIDLAAMLNAGQSISDKDNAGTHQPASLADITNDYILLLVGGDQMLVLLLTLVAVGLRFRGRAYRTLNLSPPRPLHLLLVAGLMLPLATLCGENYRIIHEQWTQFTELWPALRVLDDANAVEALQGLSQAAPLWLLVVIIAVGPAIGEELVFRGVIGRGLVARWGIVPGVLMTSLMFAAVHFHPAHALAVVPLGIALHLVYLATRSFWAPVLLHFLNNAWATLASKLVPVDANAAGVDRPASPVLLLASMTAVVVLGALLYRTRTRYLWPDGAEWDPGYFTVEVPPDETLQRINRGDITGRNLLTAGSAWAAFGAAFVAEVAALAR